MYKITHERTRAYVIETPESLTSSKTCARIHDDEMEGKARAAEQKCEKGITRMASMF
jgi:hypothetical protein